MILSMKTISSYFNVQNKNNELVQFM